MTASLNMNGTDTIARGTVIYKKGEPVQSAVLILKGRVEALADGVKTILGSGNFLGMYDMDKGIHSFTYTAIDDLTVYGLPVSNYEQIRLLLEEKPQYRGLLVASMNFFLSELSKSMGTLRQMTKKVGGFVHTAYGTYLSAIQETGLRPERINSIERMEQQEHEEFTLPPHCRYHIECGKIAPDIQKKFFNGSAYVAEKHFRDQCEVLPALLEACRHYSDLLVRYLRAMVLDERNLFFTIGKMTLSMKRSGLDSANLSELLDQMLEQINETETALIDMAGIVPELDRDKMGEVYYALLSDDTGSLNSYNEDDLKVLEGSLSQILQYSAVQHETAAEFESAVESFLSLSDKFARTKEATAVRKTLSRLFFEIYEAVTLKSFQDQCPPLAVKLFLRFGYVSEELLTEGELRTLLTMPKIDNEALECKVYTMADWLREIYEGRKNPSKDEFDMDYEGHLRQQVTEGKLLAADREKALQDPEAKLHFEVENVMRYADRLINGNITTFVPMLCSEGLYTKLETSVVTGAAVNAAVDRIEKVDYSIFYRERMTAYEEVDVSHFSITERYTPEFILFPVYGRMGMMWQDIEGRARNTHARILLPALLETELESEVLRLLSHFRWEKCRTEMGAQWNNLHYPSLTSEYTDYLQFYKKNSSLSPERKEKVKAQLQQCNNRHREVFAKDYQDWVLREATGAMRLNRVARGILFTYCPFAAEFAEVLMEQNNYQEAGRRYMTEKRKQEKNLSVIIHKFEKNGLNVPEEILQTKEYLLNT